MSPQASCLRARDTDLKTSHYNDVGAKPKMCARKTTYASAVGSVGEHQRKIDKRGGF